MQVCVMAHACNLSTPEAEAGRLVQVQGQSGLQKEEKENKTGREGKREGEKLRMGGKNKKMNPKNRVPVPQKGR